jgi:DeoR/GlpR family transcriptional regulator of sugar metabolism
MTSEERRQHLSNFLAERGFANLSALAEELNVSESTVRRDLSQLEEEGVARRTHGGAVFVSDRFSVLNYAARESAAAAEKAAIGEATAALIRDGETILLDGGTTTFQVARHLTTRALQVVTNSLPIANLLGSASNIELIFVGGYIYPRTGVALGPLAKQAIASLHVTRTIMSAAGINEDGLYNANTLMVEAEHLMMSSADEVVLVADHTKFGKRALAHLAGWDRINRVVSDSGLNRAWRDTIRQAGAKLVITREDELATARGSLGGGS